MSPYIVGSLRTNSIFWYKEMIVNMVVLVLLGNWEKREIPYISGLDIELDVPRT